MTDKKTDKKIKIGRTNANIISSINTSDVSAADQKARWLGKKLNNSLTAILDNTPEPDNSMYASTYDASARVFDVERYNTDSKFTNRPSIDDRGNVDNQTSAIGGFADEKDIESVQTTELDVAVRAIFNKLTIQDLAVELNPIANYVRAHVVLDAENCLENIGDSTLTAPFAISWYYSYSNNYQRGAISSFGDVGRIVGLRVLTLYTPIQSGFTYGGVLINNVLTVAFEEFSAQSIIAPSGRKFHFSMISLSPSLDDFIPVNEYYWFNKPITQIDKLTITLANPNNIIPIYIGRLLISNLATMFVAGNPSRFQVPSLGFAAYRTGDRVYITGFTTSDPVGDAAVIAAMNDPAGLICTKTPPVSASTLLIPVDSTGIAAYPVSPVYTCYIYNPRIRLILSMEIIYEKTALSS